MRHRRRRVSRSLRDYGGAFLALISRLVIGLGQQFGGEGIPPGAGLGHQCGRHPASVLHNRALPPQHHLRPGGAKPGQ